MEEKEIDLAIRLLHENNQKHIDPKAEPYESNLNCGLLAMARAMKELQQGVEEIRHALPK